MGMKTIYVWIVMLCLLAGCMPHKKTDGKVELDTVKVDTVKRVNVVFDAPIPACTINLKGYVFVDTVGLSPMNEQVTVYDKRGRLLALAARSSEATEFQYFKYHYDRKGKHTGFSTLSGFACDYPFIEDSILPFNDYSEEINCLYYNLVKRKYSDSLLTRYKFAWDAQGNMIKVYDPITNKKLDVPEGKRLLYRIEESRCFWTSDLHGADYHLMFYMVSNDSTDVASDTIVYDGYEPFTGWEF